MSQIKSKQYDGFTKEEKEQFKNYMKRINHNLETILNEEEQE